MSEITNKNNDVKAINKMLIEDFKKVYKNYGEIRTYFAPGRVNLIGEHTDYNGGHVFPCALTIGTYAAVSLNKDSTIRFFSINMKEMGVYRTSLDELFYDKKFGWTNYPKGVLWAAKEKGYEITTGFDIVFYGNIPNSSGLSSSASIEVLMGYVIKDLFGFDYDMVQNALMCQYAENKYVGVNCGIMDQFAIAMGKKDSAIFLDAATLEYQYAPIKMKGYKIVIMNTNKKRGLGDSKYNERRSECEKAVEEIQQVLDIKYLGELTEKQFEDTKGMIKDPDRVKRAKHAVYENQRTIKAVDALAKDNLVKFGELMTASHISLRDDYEVTGIELDTLVESALTKEGVLGARMTGAGFGGCAVSIVDENKIEDFITQVGNEYLEKIGYKADFYVVDVGDGPARLS